MVAKPHNNYTPTWPVQRGSLQLKSGILASAQHSCPASVRTGKGESSSNPAVTAYADSLVHLLLVCVSLCYAHVPTASWELFSK